MLLLAARNTSPPAIIASEPNVTWNGTPESLSISGSIAPTTTASHRNTKKLHDAETIDRLAKRKAPITPAAMPNEICVLKLAITNVFLFVRPRIFNSFPTLTIDR